MISVCRNDQHAQVTALHIAFSTHSKALLHKVCGPQSNCTNDYVVNGLGSYLWIGITKGFSLEQDLFGFQKNGEIGAVGGCTRTGYWRFFRT